VFSFAESDLNNVVVRRAFVVDRVPFSLLRLGQRNDDSVLLPSERCVGDFRRQPSEAQARRVTFLLRADCGVVVEEIIVDHEAKRRIGIIQSDIVVGALLPHAFQIDV